MVTIFGSLFSSWSSFASSSTYFLPFLVILPLVLAVILGIKGAFVR